MAIFARIVGRIWGPCFLAAASEEGTTTKDGYWKGWGVGDAGALYREGVAIPTLTYG